MSIENEIEKIWNDVQGHLAKEMKGPSFQAWIKPSKLIELIDGKATIAVKNGFHRNFLKQHYIEKITTAIENRVKQRLFVDIVVKENLNLSDFFPSIAYLEETESQDIKNIKKQNPGNDKGYIL